MTQDASKTEECPRSLSGKFAVVTGASRGLGKRLCEALALEGVRVAFLSRNASRLQAAADDIDDMAVAFPVDISDPSAESSRIELRPM